jgi:hypothetical protein
VSTRQPAVDEGKHAWESSVCFCFYRPSNATASIGAHLDRRSRRELRLFSSSDRAIGRFFHTHGCRYELFASLSLLFFLISIYISLNRHHLINDVVNFRSTVELEYLVIWFSGAGALSDRLIYYHRPSGTHEVARNGQPGYVRPKPGRRRPPVLSIEKFLLYCHRVDRSERNNNLVAVLAGITCRSSREGLVPPSN